MNPKRIQKLMRKELDDEFRNFLISKIINAHCSKCKNNWLSKLYINGKLIHTTYLKNMFIYKPEQFMSTTGFFEKFIPIDFRNEGN